MHMNKRILSLTLALVMILGTFTAVFAEVTTVEQKAAEFLRDNGVLEGDEKGDLLLDKKLERRDAVVLSARLLGEEEKAANTKFDEKTPSWTDVRTDKFYVPFFAWAETTGRFEGKGEGIFEPRAGLTTQEYATVLLRILGHELNGKDAWKSVMELAKKEGLLENVDAKADDILMRGNMAVMTLNALGATVKGTGKTLADELNIKLPVPAKLAVEDVYADNLAEVTVKLNEAVVDSKELENTDNYTLNKGLTVEKATHLEDKNIVLLQVIKDGKESGKMKNGVEYNLKIKGIKDLGNLSFDFKANDNETPFIEKVEALGTKAVKVTFSEPVKEVRRQNFELDGKRVLADINQNGREVTLRVFSKLTVGEHDLVVKGIEDFAGFKMPSVAEEFEVVEDNIKPEVVSIQATTKAVIVEFSEDVDTKTINDKSAYWMFGKTSKYSNKHEFLSGNKVKFEFTKNELPLRDVDFVVEKVEDYSGNIMDKYETVVSAELDRIAPEVTEAVIGKTKDKVIVKFNKPVYMHDKADEALGSAINKKYYTVKDSKDKVVKIIDVKSNNGSDKEVVITLDAYLEDGKDYSIEVVGIHDTNRYPNVLEMWEGQISLEDKEQPKISEVYLENTKVDTNGKPVEQKISLFFSKEMDLQTIYNPENYMIRLKNETNEKAVKLTELDSDIDVKKGYKNVEITIYLSEEDVEKGYAVDSIAVLEVKDTNGKLVDEYGIFQRISDKVEEFKATVESVTSTDKVVLKFNDNVNKFNKDKVKGNLNVKDYSINGEKVTLTIEELKVEDIENKTISLETGAAISRAGVQSKALESINLENKIAPKVKSLDYAKESKILTVEFDTEMKTLGDEQTGDTNAIKVLASEKGGKDYPVAVTKFDVENNTIKLTLDSFNDELKDKEIKLTIEVLNKNAVKSKNGVMIEELKPEVQTDYFVNEA